VPNSIRTTLNTQVTNNSTLATLFKAGDSVLCPSVSNESYTLQEHESKRLMLSGSTNCQFFYTDGRSSPDDTLTLLFHDTQASRQAIATLYSGSQSSQRQVIDTTAPDDNEVLLISSRMLSDIACDINGAATALYDIGQLLELIHYNKIEAHTAPALARLAHDAANTWASLLYEKLEQINETLAMTGYGKEGSQ